MSATRTTGGSGTGSDAPGSDSPDGDFDSVPATPMKAFAKLRGWRALRSMRTAIWLLLVLALVTFLVPIWVPQRITEAESVRDLAQDSPGLYEVLDRLQAFDVFSAWWYVAIYGALLFVLVNCLVPRTRNWPRQRRRSVSTPRARNGLPALPHTVQLTTEMPPDEAAAVVTETLSRRRFRVGAANGRGQSVAEKGSLRELGSLVFHWSFFLLLLGMFLTGQFGWEGQAVLVEGERWVEAPVNYDFYDPGAFVGTQDHRGFEVELDSFDVSFFDDGGAASFVAAVRLTDDGVEVLEKDVRVNDPLDYRGVKLFLVSWGWTTRITVADANGEAVFDDDVILFPDGPRNSWRGVVKLPGQDPQVGMEVLFFPDAVVLTPDQAESFDDELGPGVRLAQRPGPPTLGSSVVLIREWKGDLGFDQRSQTVYELRTEDMELAETGLARQDVDQYEFRDGLTISFPGVSHYAIFTVKRDPGLWTVLLAAIFLMTGLVASLYVYRRRLWIWVRASEAGDLRDDMRHGDEETHESGGTDGRSGDRAPDGSRGRLRAGPGTLITLGGLAYQRKDAFEAEFQRLVETLAGRLDAQRTGPGETGSPTGGPDVDAQVDGTGAHDKARDRAGGGPGSAQSVSPER